MRTWAGLYGMTWTLFLVIALSLTPVGQPYVGYLHMVLGVIVVGLAYLNRQQVTASGAPGRVKRTVRSTFQLSVVLGAFGLLLLVVRGTSTTLLPGITLTGLLVFFHFVLAMAMFAQAAAAGIAFDMWEEREFERTTAPGEVPAPPLPTAAARGPSAGATAVLTDPSPRPAATIPPKA